jgi:hypothetical protein
MTRILTIIALLFATPAWAEMVLYCQDELAVGIQKQDGSFDARKFNLYRHTVKFDEKNMTLKGLKVGIASVTMFCSKTYKNTQPDLIFCVDAAESYFTFIFSTESLRYSYSQPYYTSWIRGGSDTSHTSHGTCQKF